MRTITSALKTVLHSKGNRWLALSAFAVLLAFYLMTLPAAYTGGRIGPAALQFLDVTMALFALVMASLTALLIPMMVYLMRNGRGASKSSAAGGVLVGVLTPVLCCSPLLPLALGALAALFPSVVTAFGWQLQGFIATHQNELLLAAVALLALALYQNSVRVVRGARCSV